MNVAEAYYCTKNGKIKGVFTLTEHLILFDPIKCTENDKFVRLLPLQYFNSIWVLSLSHFFMMCVKIVIPL